jgi:hypothetical protein
MDIILNQVRILFNEFVASYGAEGVIGIGTAILIGLGVVSETFKK